MAAAAQEVLRAAGVAVRSEWLQACAEHLEGARSAAGAAAAVAEPERWLAQFLLSDMNASGAGTLPPAVAALHNATLAGPFVLQVDEAMDISTPAKERHNESGGEPPGRCLKLSLTDGVQRVAAIEYRRISAIAIHMPAGVKIVVRNVPVRRGLLLLSPESVEVLGGCVEALEKARKKAVKRWNQPARGARRRGRRGAAGRVGGGPPTPSLREEATAAAWSNDSEGNAAETMPQMESVAQRTSEQRVSQQEATRDFGRASGSVSSAETEQRERVRTEMETGSMQPGEHTAAGQSVAPEATFFPSQRVRHQQPHHAQTADTEHLPGSSIGSGLIHSNPEEADNRETLDRGRATEQGGGPADLDEDSDVQIVIINEGTSRQRSAEDADLRQVGGRSFTYLATLLRPDPRSNVAPSQTVGFTGRHWIKCLFTSVKEFKMENFGLVVTLEDGSLLCSARVDEPVIEQILGITAEEAVASLLCHGTERERKVKRKLKNMEVFLEEFEGVVEVEWDYVEELVLVVAMSAGADRIDSRRLLELVNREC